MDKSTLQSCGLPILGQLLSLIPSKVFKSGVSAYQSDKWYKQVRTWDQFVFLFYGILTGSSSLREIEKNFMLLGDKLAHCGLTKIPRRSSISDANAGRKADVFGHIYLGLYHHYQDILSDSYLPTRINGEVSARNVEIFDSTTISLFKDIFKNSGRLAPNGKRKGGIKAFTKIKLSERVPDFVHLRAAATNERLFLSFLELSKGTIAVFDKGYQKFSQFQEWTDSGVFFVTRMNQNAYFQIERTRPVVHQIEQGVQKDQDIQLRYVGSDKKEHFTHARMVAYIDPESGKKLTFVTNLMKVKAETVCRLYQNRWTIEPLFKQIKQNFELTRFLSDSEEGIKSQIWVALILNLLFSVIHAMIKEAEDFATMVKLAAKNTASYINFIQFLTLANQQRKNQRHDLEIVQLEIFPQTLSPPL